MVESIAPASGHRPVSLLRSVTHHLFPGCGNNVSGLEAKVLPNHHRRRQTEGIQAKDASTEAGIAFPAEAGRRFDGDARPECGNAQTRSSGAGILLKIVRSLGRIENQIGTRTVEDEVMHVCRARNIRAIT